MDGSQSHTNGEFDSLEPMPLDEGPQVETDTEVEDAIPDPVQRIVAPEPAGSAIGDQVLEILQDVERQFDRLKDVQDTHARELETLADRTSSVESREQELAERTTEYEEAEQRLAGQAENLQSQQAELEALQNTLDEQRGALESQQTDLEERTRQFEADDQVLRKRLEDIEGACAELEQREVSLTGEAESLTTQVEEAHRAVDTQRSRAEEAERSAAELQGRVGQLEQELATQQRQTEQGVAEQEDARRELEELQERLDGLNGTISDRNEVIASQESKIRALESRVAGFDDDQSRVAADLDAARRESDALREQVQQLAGEIESLQTRGEAQASAARQAQQEAEILRLKLENAESQLDRGQGQIDEMGRHTQEQEGRLGEVTSELAEHRQRVQALQGELETQGAIIGQRDQRVAEHTSTIKDLEDKLELTGGKLRKLSELLKEQGPRLEHGAIAVATVGQQKQQIENLTRELAEAKLAAQPEELKRRDERIKGLTEALKQARGQTGADVNVSDLEHQNAELEQQVNSLRLSLEKSEVDARETRRQLDEMGNRVGSQDTDVAAFSLERETLKHRIGELEEQLDTAKQQAASSPSSEGETKRLIRDDEHLQRRRTRLGAVRKRLRKVEVAAAAAEELRKFNASRAKDIDSDRERLEEVKQILADTERTMIKRWSRPRALVITGWFFLLLAIAAAGSWFGAGYIKPPRIVASVTLLAVPDDGDLPTAADMHVWQQTHRELVDEASFASAVAERCADRQFVTFAHARSVSDRFERDLRIDDTQAGRLTLSLAGDNSSETRQLLDLVATTLVQQAADGPTPLAAEAVVLGERHERGRVTYATLGPVPIQDDRVQVAGPMFGGAALVMILIFAWVVRRLQRASRVTRADTRMPAPA